MDAIRAASDPNAGYENVRNGLVRVGQEAYKLIKNNSVSVNQWSNPKLIILGGGSCSPELCKVLKRHPMTNFSGGILNRLDLQIPDDLFRKDETSVKPKDVAFTSVAYGLAQLGGSVPEATRPNEVQPVRHHIIGTLPSHEEIYGD
jgi:hypothetical protein